MALAFTPFDCSKQANSISRSLSLATYITRPEISESLISDDSKSPKQLGLQ